MDMQNPACYACIHCYDGADGVKRCRVDTNGLPCTPALEADCWKFVREPGADDQVAPWYTDAWDQGRA